MKKQTGILFSGPMIRALMTCAKCGRISVPFPCKHCGSTEFVKTQTRRVVKPQVNCIRWETVVLNGYRGGWVDEHGRPMPCPYGGPGDLLLPRETWLLLDKDHRVDSTKYAYRADQRIVNGQPDADSERCRKELGYKWRSSIFMPKEATRIWLRISEIRVQRLQSISEEDAKAEGVEFLFTQDQCNTVAGIVGTKPEDHGYRNYLWHGDFGQYGTGNKRSDAWPHQYSSYDSAKGSYSSLWELINGSPKPAKHNPYTNAREDCYVSYPWEDVQKTETLRGKTHYIVGNCWLWVISFLRTARP